MCINIWRSTIRQEGNKSNKEYEIQQIYNRYSGDLMLVEGKTGNEGEEVGEDDGTEGRRV